MAQLLHSTRFTSPNPVQASFTVTIPATQAGSTLIVPAGGGAVITLRLGASGPTFNKRIRSLAGMEIACHDIVDTTGGTTTITVTLNGAETVDGMIFEFASGSVGTFIGGATDPGGAGSTANSLNNTPTGPITTTTPSLYFSMFATTGNPSATPAQNQYWGLEPLGKQFVNAYNSGGPSHYWSLIGLSSLANAGTYTGNSSSVLPGYQAGSWAYVDLRPDLPAYVNPYANAIQAENSLPGSVKESWAGATTNPNIAGYTDKITYNPGDTVGFKIDSINTGFTVEISRFGGYGYSDFSARRQTTVTGSPVVQPAPTTNSYGGMVCNWQTTATWAIPATATPGIYLYNMRRSDNSSYVASGVFVVKSPVPSTRNSQVMVATSEFTWQAYNCWGATSDNGGFSGFSGRSIYAHAPTSNSFADRAFAVSFDRPLGTVSVNTTSFFWDTECSLVNFLEMNGYDVAYFTSTDLDIDPTIPSKFQAAVSHGHSEYWSTNLRNAYENARDSGTNVIFISGNTALWHVRFDPTDSNRRTMICYKDSTNTTGWDNTTKYDPISYTGTWRDVRTVSGGVNNTARRPESGMTGQWFIGNGTFNDTLAVSTDFANLPIWRNTSLATSPSITVRATVSTSLSAAGTSFSFTTPGSMQIGDLVVCAIVFNGDPGGFDFTAYGFRQVRFVKDGTAQTTAIGILYAKTAGAQSITIGWSNSVLATAAVAIYGNAVWQDAMSSLVADTSGGSIHATAITANGGANRWAVAIFADSTTSHTTATTSWVAGAGLATQAVASNSSNAGGPWASIAIMDSEGPVAQGTHTYSATAQYANAHASAGLFYIVPGVAARMVTIGTEWDYIKREEPSTPANLVALSSQAFPLGAQAAVYNGDTYFNNGIYQYGLSMYRANSGALVFNAGTWRFSYGLSRVRAAGVDPTWSIDPLCQQATINLLGDMGVNPGSVMTTVQNNDPTALVGPGTPASASSYGLTLSPVNYQTIFRADQEPVTRNAVDGNQYTLATVFTSDSAGQAYGVRWYFPDALPNQAVIGALYSWGSETTGAELARVTFTNVQTGWCQALFASPVSLSANTKYAVAVWTPDNFPVTNSFFTSAVSNGSNLTALQDTASAHNGKYSIGAGPAYPTFTFQSSAYFADVLFLSDGSNPANLKGWGMPIG